MSSIDLPVIPPPAPPPPQSRTVVVRYGYLRYIGEFPFDVGERMGCGAKVVIKTRRGTEIAEVLSTTCESNGCGKSVSREQIRDYIDHSGGNDFPFSTEGRVLRLATHEDLLEQKRLEEEKPRYIAECRQLIRESGLPMKLVDVELLLGGEMTTFFFLSEHRVDFRNLVKTLASRFHTRIQMHQVGSRDEARLVADFETCGQHCCCRQFLKVLRPVNMGSAKMQKATLDPSKISGRCGRLKCCLRYEEQSYEELRRKLPRNGTRVRVEDGVGVVIETMILTQLVKIRLGDDRIVAVANEELLERDVKDGGMMPARARQRDEEEEQETLRPRDGRRENRPAQQPQAQREEQEESAVAEARNARLRGRRGTPPSAAQTPQDATEDQLQDGPEVQAHQEREESTAMDEQPPSQQPSQQAAGTAPQGMGSLGKRRRRRRGRHRGGPPREGGPGPAPRPM